MLTQAQFDKPAEQSPMLERQSNEPARTDSAGQPMRDDHDSGVILSGLGDLSQHLQHPLGYLARALTGRRPAYVLPCPESARQLGVSCPDLLAEQALPGADVDLAQPLIGDDLQPGALGEHRCGLIRTATGRWSTN